MTNSTANSAQPGSIKRINHGGPEGQGLVPWEAMDPATLAAGTPVQSGALYGEDDARGYSAGVWYCTAFDDAPGPYPVDEYMLLLEGEVVIALPSGEEVRISAGEAFILPQGLECQWKMPVPVRKIFMIVENDGRTTSQNTSLTRVTKPSLSPSAPAPDAVALSETVFHSADGQMQVLRRSYSQSFRGPMPATGQRIVTVLTGEIRIDDETFGVNDSFYADANDSSDWSVAAATTFIEARYQPSALA